MTSEKTAAGGRGAPGTAGSGRRNSPDTDTPPSDGGAQVHGSDERWGTAAVARGMDAHHLAAAERQVPSRDTATQVEGPQEVTSEGDSVSRQGGGARKHTLRYTTTPENR